MFSNRLSSTASPNRIAAALAERRAAGSGILDLTEANPTAAGFEYDTERIARAIGDARALRYEPSPWGLESAREAVAGYYRKRGFEAETGKILLTASTSEAYAYLFKLLCDPGDEVLIPRPSYPLFDYLAELESVRLRPYSLFYDDGWHIDLHQLEQQRTERTRAVVLVNPNNPTGSYARAGEHAHLLELCSRHGMAIISDEVFSDYNFGDLAGRVRFAAARSEALSFSLSGLSKIAGLPQMKLGWIAANGPATVLAEALEKLELIADTYLSVGTPVQLALPELLGAGEGVQAGIRARTERNLGVLDSVLAGTAGRRLRVEGGWYAVLQVPRVRTEEEWVLELLSRGVLVQPGFFFDFLGEAYLVLSLLTPEAVFRQGLEHLAQMLAPG